MACDRTFYQKFFSLTFTIALQNLIVFSVSLADNVMLGAYQETSLSGVALANQIQFLLQMLTMGVGEGVAVLGAQYWGKRDTESIKRILSGALRLGLVIAALLWAAVFFFPHEVLSLFIEEEAVIAEGVSYLRVICFSYFFFSFTNIMLCALRSVETVRVGILVSTSTLIINVCLNYLLIFGNLGAPRLGAAGAAAATLTARAAESVILVLYLSFADKKLRLRWHKLLSFDRSLFRDYLRTGSPVLASNGIWGLAMGLQTAILGHLGSEAVAANSIATTVFQVLTVAAYGSASASAVIIGKTIGEGKLEKVRQYAKTMQLLFLAIGLATGAALFLVRDTVLSFYAISAESRQLAEQFLLILSVTSVGTSYQMPVLTGIVRGGGDTSFVFINDSIFMWGIVLPCSAAAAFLLNLPPAAVFLCLKSDQILKCFVAVVKVNRFRWIRSLARQAAA